MPLFVILILLCLAVLTVLVEMSPRGRSKLLDNIWWLLLLILFGGAALMMVIS